MIGRKSVMCISTILLIFSLYGCSKKEMGQETISLIEPISVNQVYETVSYGDVNKMKIYDAYVLPETEELSFTRDGMIQKITVEVGDTVKKGDVLAVLDDTIYEEEIINKTTLLASMEESYQWEKKQLEDQIYSKEKERIEIENQIKLSEIAKKTVDIQIDTSEIVTPEEEVINIKELEEKKIQLVYDISTLKETLDKNKKIYEIDKQIGKDKLTKAKEEVGKNKIYANFDGSVIGISSKKEGDYITSNTSIIGLVNSLGTKVTCDFIYETDINKAVEYYLLKDNVKYNVTYIPYDKEVYAALVLREEKLVSTFHFNDENQMVSQGEYVLICVVEERAEDVLTIPIDCIYKDTNGNYVYLEENGYRVKQYVVTGLSDTIRTEIMEGLEEGDRVYAEY